MSWSHIFNRCINFKYRALDYSSLISLGTKFMTRNNKFKGKTEREGNGS